MRSGGKIKAHANITIKTAPLTHFHLLLLVASLRQYMKLYRR